MGLVAQWAPSEKSDLLVVREWIFLSHQPQKTIVARVKMISILIRKGHKQAVELSSKEIQTLFLPLTQDYLEWGQANSLALQVALEGFSGRLSIHLPAHKLFSFCREVSLVCKPLCQATLVPGRTVFTDESGKTGKAVMVWHENGNWQH